MPYSANQPLIRELQTARKDINPQIRGLNDLTNVSISAALRAVIGLELKVLERRRSLIDAMLGALHDSDAVYAELLADGYPALNPVLIDWSLYLELQSETSDLSLAASVFKPDPKRPTTLGLDLNAVWDSPQPRPPA